MSRFFRRVLKESTSRILFSIIVSIMFIGIILVSLWIQLKMNQDSYMNHYEQMQSNMTEQLNDELSFMLEENLTEQQIVQKMIKSKVNSSNQWCFLTKNTRIIHTKDANSLVMFTNSGITNEAQLLHWLEEKNQIVTTNVLVSGNDTYTVGIMSDRNSVLLNSNLSSHSTFVMVTVVFLCMVFFSAFIFAITRINIRDKELHRLRKDLKGKSRKLEAMSESAMVGNEAYEEIAATAEIYDESILIALLQQSNDAKLFPMGIMCIKMKLSSRYYEKDELYSLMNHVQNMLQKNHRMIEVGKGEFVLLLYRCDEQEYNAINHEVKQYLKAELPEHDIKAKISKCYIGHVPEIDEESILDKYHQLRKIFKTEGDRA